MVEMAKTGVFLGIAILQIILGESLSTFWKARSEKKIRNEEKQKSWLYIANSEGFLSFQSSIEENAAPELS